MVIVLRRRTLEEAEDNILYQQLDPSIKPEAAHELLFTLNIEITMSVFSPL